MYEESFRTPLMIRWPKQIKAGSVNRDMVMNLDFAETFLDVAGESIPDDMQGRSLLPLLAGETPDDWRTSLYYHYYEFPGPHSVRRHYGVRTDRYKLIHYYHVGQWELFDLEQDPQEVRSVYDDPQYADVRAELLKELQRLRRYYRDDGTIRGKVDPPPKR
jgi:arylsulfatase A-like enzyme